MAKRSRPNAVFCLAPGASGGKCKDLCEVLGGLGRCVGASRQRPFRDLNPHPIFRDAECDYFSKTNSDAEYDYLGTSARVRPPPPPKRVRPRVATLRAACRKLIEVDVLLGLLTVHVGQHFFNELVVRVGCVRHERARVFFSPFFFLSLTNHRSSSRTPRRTYANQKRSCGVQLARESAPDQTPSSKTGGALGVLRPTLNLCSCRAPRGSASRRGW